MIPVRDRPDQLDRCLAALAPAGCVVVDDASRDPDAVAAVARGTARRCSRSTDNVGPAGARNAGLAKVSDAVRRLRRLRRRGRRRRRCSAWPATSPTRGSRWSARGSRACRPVGAAALVRALRRRRRPRSTSAPIPALVRPGAAVAWLPSACLVGRTDAPSASAGSTPDLRVGEDVDLVWRLVDGRPPRPLRPRRASPTTTPAPPCAAGSAASSSTAPAAPPSPHATATGRAPAVLSPTCASPRPSAARAATLVGPGRRWLALARRATRSAGTPARHAATRTASPPRSSLSRPRLGVRQESRAAAAALVASRCSRRPRAPGVRGAPSSLRSCGTCSIIARSPLRASPTLSSPDEQTTWPTAPDSGGVRSEVARRGSWCPGSRGFGALELKPSGDETLVLMGIRALWPCPRGNVRLDVG